MRCDLATVFVALLLFSVLSGCAMHDRPTMIKPPAIKVGDLVPYKRLTRDDFRASSPPENITEVSRAAICTQIVLSPHGGIQVGLKHTGDGRQTYEATLANPGFYAVANRACSWWNADSPSVEKEEEILEHEQVHFAITELAARELNRRTSEVTKELRSIGNTPAEAIAGIKEDFIVRVRQDFLKQDEKFDEEMSGLFASRAGQKEWLRQVESELLYTQVYAEGPSIQTQVAEVHELLQVQGMP